jgi:hypothetical protein
MRERLHGEYEQTITENLQVYNQSTRFKKQGEMPFLIIDITKQIN